MKGKYLLKVNDISENKNFGTTNKIEDIKYNLKLFPKEVLQEFEIYGALSGNGLTSVFHIGRFIIILKINNSNTEGQMRFFDFDINIKVEEIKKGLELEYDEKIINKWFKYYYHLREDFNSEDDFIELVLS
jgi:hypothetical protein